MRPIMSRSIRLASAGAVILAAAGVVASVTVASGATTSAPGRNAAPAAKIPALSHQLCYTSTAKGFKIPPKAVLVNMFSPKGFGVAIGPAVANCNPVIKILPTGKIFPITYHPGHLACYTIKTAPQQLPPVVVNNQFGTAALNLSTPTALCLPTWKSLTGPPKEPANQPPFLDHFTCYPIISTNGKFSVPAVQLKDEFTKKPVRVKLKQQPTQFCVPTIKILPGQAPTKILHPGTFLTCFPVSKTPIKPKVFDLNQFGRAVVTIKQTSLLCLPSRQVKGTAKS